MVAASFQWSTLRTAPGLRFNPIEIVEEHEGSIKLGFLDFLKATDCVDFHLKSYQFEILNRPGEGMDQKRL